MPTALEVELKTYAHEFIADHLKEEYDSQIRKWQQHINRMVDAQTEALNSHLKVLDDARKQIEAERQAAFGMAMLALSLVSGPVLAWIGSKIQYTWFPKYATNPRMQERRYPTAAGGLRPVVSEFVWCSWCFSLLPTQRFPPRSAVSGAYLAAYSPKSPGKFSASARRTRFRAAVSSPRSCLTNAQGQRSSIRGASASASAFA